MTEYNIPRWNLETLFSSLNSENYKNAKNDYKKAMDENEALIQTAEKFTLSANSNFDFAVWLDAYLKSLNKISSLEKTLGAYAYIVYSTDTTNPEYTNELIRIQEESIRFEQLYLKFSTLLLSHRDFLDDFYRRYPSYKDYKYFLDEVLEGTKHQMTPAEEKIASVMGLTGGDAWSVLHEQLISNAKSPDGKTFNEIRNLAYSADPKERKEAWEVEKKLLEQNRISFAACLSNIKGETCALNSKRNWACALDRSLFASRMSRKTLDALIGALEDALPMWREYFKAKALLLRKADATASKTSGTKEDKGLAFYDLFAPVENPCRNEAEDKNSLLSRKWTFEEAKEVIVREYGSFSSSMADFARKVFDEGWIDAEVREGKVGGAYDEDFPLGHQSRILSNFTGVFNDIITLAHEIGHAYHFSCLKGKDSVFFDYPMTLAESASTFAETIVKQNLIKQSSGFDKIRMIELDLQDASQVLVDILCRFYFEKSVFDKREKESLGADEFCELMKEAQEKSYGDGLNNERHEYMWAVKSHYYSPDLDFYNFPYAFGQLFSAALYALGKKEGASFAEKYAQILSNTGSMSCESLCESAGFDITSKDFWKAGIAMYAEEVREFKSFAEQSKIL